MTVRNEDGKWSEIAAGVYRKPLISNGTVSAALYRMLPGSFYPAHDHVADEECLCLEGEVDLGGMVIRAGEFQFAPQGSAHGIIRSASGCVLYIRTLCKATAEHS